jgi:hypothetical protein
MDLAGVADIGFAFGPPASVVSEKVKLMVGGSIQRSYLLLSGYFILTLFAVAGCGGSGLATVKGKVTIDGQPASSGRVFFRSADGKSTVFAMIGPDGAYQVVEVPYGSMKVTVTPLTKWERIGLIRDARKMKKTSASEAPATPGGADAFESSAKIPEKYRDPDTSGLTFTVKSGTNTYNIEIKSE